MHIVILGNGISGITAARFVRKLSDHRITVVSSETDHFFFAHSPDVHLHGTYAL